MGKQQHYALGEFTRTRYDGFIPTKYDPKAFKAQTTDVDRTHMSCQSNIAAIFPPDEDEMFEDGLLWQPIPVHPISTNIFNGACSIVTTEQAYIALKDPLYAQLNIQFADLYTYLTNYSGYNVTTISGVGTLRDAMYIETRFNYTQPDWAQSVYPEPIEVLNGYAIGLATYTTVMKRLSK